MVKDYDIIPNHGHYDVYINEKFYCSADTMPEAIKEVRLALECKEA